MKKLEIGIIGMGSMGQRHARGLASLGVAVRAFRTRRGSVTSLPTDLAFVVEYDDNSGFFSSGPDAVIIANPTSLHASTLELVLRRSDVPVLVEKPLASHAGELTAV